MGLTIYIAGRRTILYISPFPAKYLDIFLNASTPLTSDKRKPLIIIVALRVIEWVILDLLEHTRQVGKKRILLSLDIGDVTDWHVSS